MSSANQEQDVCAADRCREVSVGVWVVCLALPGEVSAETYLPLCRVHRLSPLAPEPAVVCVEMLDQ